MTTKKTSAQLDQEIAEVLSRPAPTRIGVSPAGVEWVAYDPRHIAPMKQRLETLQKRHAGRSTPKQEAPQKQHAGSTPEQEAPPKQHAGSTLEQAQSKYEALRARVYRAQGMRRKRGREAMSDDAYWELSEELRAARKALRAAERKARRKR